MAITKVINDLIDLNQSGSTNGLKGCAGTTAQQPTSSFDIDYLIVGGGGAATTGTSGGGGAGGLLTGTTSVASGSSFVLTVGEGGLNTGATTSQDSYSGNDSGFAGLRAVGGGAAPRRNDYGEWALPGGSGSGASIGTGDSATSQADGGLGVSGQGNNGGANAAVGNLSAGGGGGGAGAVGTAGSSGTGGGGGIGSELSSFITYTDAASASVGEVSGTNVYFAGGGGASGYSGGTYTQTAGTGGLGGGGNGGYGSGVDGEDGAANTGGGAGGGDGTSSLGNGGDGGSGVVILKYDNTVVNSVTVDGTLLDPVSTTTSSTCSYPTTATALYQFEGNANDTCGNYNGTASSVTYAAGKYGQAAVFNGSNSSIILPQSTDFDLNGAGSFSIWVNRNDTTTRWIFEKANGGSGTYGWQLFFVGTDYRFQMHDTSNNVITASTSSGVAINTWEHIVVTSSASKVYKIYFNGVLEDTQTLSGTVSVNTNGPRFGEYSLAGGYNFDGEIDQTRFFPSELTATQVKLLYNENILTKFTNGTTDTIVFKEGSGNITLNKADSDPGAEIGMLRCNTTLGQMEHYNSTGYKDFTNL
jgi:hypothetical protein